MILIVGLGNPGKKYKKTRHNVGWLVLEALAKQLVIKKLVIEGWEIERELNARVLAGREIVLAKPLNFMNKSGRVVKSLIANYSITQLLNVYVIHDDLDISLGSFKIQFGKGPKEHKGIKSVEGALGTKDFWRVRVGIENRSSRLLTPRSELTGEDYVLGEFTKEELKVLEGAMPKVVGKLLEYVKRT